MQIINREQVEASRPDCGINLVLAGAGTGKTSTMINKIKNIIQNNIVKAENILILTFSKKAAVEIKERLTKETGSATDIGFSGTFHAFSLHLLVKFKTTYLQHKRFKSFPVIIEKNQKDDIIRQLIMGEPERFLGLPSDVVLHLLESLNYISERYKNKLKTSGLYNEICNLKIRFEEYKTINNLLEFEDIINHICEIIELYPNIQNEIISTFNYIFVDEFQDTSENNFRLLSLILSSRNNKNLFMVGDDYQSIYKFRYARIDYIINSRKFFPEIKIHKLTINYRSRKEIVSLADKFIKINRFRTSKKIKSYKGSGGKVLIYHALDIYHESEIIKKILLEEKSCLTLAILYRNNYQGAFLEKKLQFNDYAFNMKLMTMHSSKGLEFSTVIIAGICDKIIPDRTSDIEEERRLFYVAMTRAEEKLHLVYYKNNDGSMPKFMKETGFRD